jgi:Mn2+/Fe2+ NRAMP family transporter
LTIEQIKPARLDTFIGAIITQLIMASVLIVTAATIGKTNPNTPLNTIGDISHAITPFVGITTGRILFALGMAGGALVATIVVSLTAAWGVGEVMGFRRSLEDHPQDAPWFYGIYTIILILSAGLIASNILNLVKLSVAIEVMNAILLPIVLGFLFLLARRAIPNEYRLKGWYGVLVGIILLITSLFGFISGVWGSLFL